MNLYNEINSKTLSIILGGGVGSRLYPLTKERSKPAVPIAGKYRLIDIPISNCLNSGLNRIFVLTQYNSASLNRHISNSFRFDHFSHGFVDVLAAEQTKESNQWFQGTADAVRQSIRNFSFQSFEYILILSGDQLYQMDLQALIKQHESSKSDVTIATIPVHADLAPSFGIMKVNKDNVIDSFVEKPKAEEVSNWQSELEEHYVNEGRNYLASMGIYVFNKKVLYDLLAENPDTLDFGKEIIPKSLYSGKKVSSFLYDGYWEDIGDIRAFFEANLALTNEIPAFNLYDSENPIFTNPRLLPPSKVFGTRFKKVVLAEGCFIHAKCIENSVVGIRSRIGEGTIIDRCIIMGNDYYETLDELKSNNNEHSIGIGENCYLKNVIADKHVYIGDNVEIIGDDSLDNVETDNYVIKKGIVVLNKGAVIPEGTKIGLARKD
ncbi:MAG: glucose-1-phosphate adenylyltransferase [Flavobacteriia bacterium]|nr:MAG: glucose-1-phosphate adenylyltransferase [Flavobacteriia bacterium]